MTYMIEALADSSPIKITRAKGEALLTTRENQVVSLVSQGLGNRAIARSRNGTPKILLRSRDFISYIFDKLEISNRVELVLYAMSRRQTTQIPNPNKLCSITGQESKRQVSKDKDEVKVSSVGDTVLPILVATGAA
jgi:hypothetical protein